MGFLADPLSTLIVGGLGYKAYKKHRENKAAPVAEQAKAQPPKQGDVSYEPVDDVKRYEPGDDYGYGTPTSTQALFKKRHPLGI